MQNYNAITLSKFNTAYIPTRLLWFFPLFGVNESSISNPNAAMEDSIPAYERLHHTIDFNKYLGNSNQVRLSCCLSRKIQTY